MKMKHARKEENHIQDELRNFAHGFRFNKNMHGPNNWPYNNTYIILCITCNLKCVLIFVPSYTSSETFHNPLSNSF